MSGEPSMEEILSSIKRIIAEEGDSPIRGRRAGRATPLPPALGRPDADDDEVLELSHPIPADDPAIGSPANMSAAVAPLAEIAPAPAPPPAPAAAEPAPVEAVMPPMPTVADAAEPILSTQAAEASRSALDSLSRLIVKPEPSGDGTLEGMVRDMLRPMLRDWLDANLPALVETMVQAEIARITGKSR